MKLSEIGEKITEKEINFLETTLEVKIPQDYKDFLLKNNGGIPEEIQMFSFCEIDPENGKEYEMETDIQNFSSINDIPFYYKNLIGARAIPEKYLSIACDSCGNEILLCANEFENYGKIFFGNHEMYHPETNYFNMTLIADSFTEFLNIVYEG